MREQLPLMQNDRTATPPRGLRRMPEFVKGFSAQESACGNYRYALMREWGDGPKALFMLKNPSRASAIFDDPTVAKLYPFSRAFGCDGFVLINPFAYRATDPRDLYRVADELRIGPDNDDAIKQALRELSGPLVLGWGKPPTLVQHQRVWNARIAQVLEMIADAEAEPYCLGINSDGSPEHPLFIKSDAKLVRFEARAA